MTEKEYINVKALGTIGAALDVLKDIVPENLESVMTKEEYQMVMATIYGWQRKLFSKIKTKGE